MLLHIFVKDHPITMHSSVFSLPSMPRCSEIHINHLMPVNQVYHLHAIILYNHSLHSSNVSPAAMQPTRAGDDLEGGLTTSIFFWISLSINYHNPHFNHVMT